MIYLSIILLGMSLYTGWISLLLLLATDPKMQASMGVDLLHRDKLPRPQRIALYLVIGGYMLVWPMLHVISNFRRLRRCNAPGCKPAITNTDTNHKSGN